MKPNIWYWAECTQRAEIVGADIIWSEKNADGDWVEQKRHTVTPAWIARLDQIAPRHVCSVGKPFNMAQKIEQFEKAGYTHSEAVKCSAFAAYVHEHLNGRGVK